MLGSCVSNMTLRYAVLRVGNISQTLSTYFSGLLEELSFWIQQEFGVGCNESARGQSGRIASFMQLLLEAHDPGPTRLDRSMREGRRCKSPTILEMLLPEPDIPSLSSSLQRPRERTNSEVSKNMTT